MITRCLRFALVSAAVLSACVLAAELGRRVLDGYQLRGLELAKDPHNLDLLSSDRHRARTPSTDGLLATIARDPEADTAWFYDRPLPLSGTSEPWADRRRAAFGPEANYVWNALTLYDSGPQSFLQKNQAHLEELLTFRPPGGERYPAYRLYPDIQSGFGFTNQFGWRGRPIDRDKPPDVVRIGVLGDSTTGGYPWLLEHWLNLWSARRSLGVRFEVVNTARPAIGALDAAAILDFELGSLDVDYAVVYGFGNGIHFADALVSLPPGVVRGQAAPTAGLFDAVTARIDRVLAPAARWSAAAIFLRSRLNGQIGSAPLAEPRKPASRIVFPPGIDERSPDPGKIAAHTGGGLMLLDTYLQALNRIDQIVKARQVRLFVSTFRVMAFDGMLLGGADDDSGRLLYHYLNNEAWWPYTYAELHRLSDFYNRTLQVWARTKGHQVIPVNEQMPWLPDLYHDGLHELLAGEALHAWIVLQQLMPAIRDDLTHHRLPRSKPPPRADVDAYWKIERMPVARVLAVATLVPPRPAPGTAIPAEIPAATPESVADIPGALTLSGLVAAHPRAKVVPGVVAVITTPAEPLADAASIRLEVAGLTGKGRVRLRLRVTEGRLSIRAMHKSPRRFLSVVSVEQNNDMQEVTLPIDDLSDLGSIMITNDRGTDMVRSVAELHGVVLQRLR